MKKIFRTLAIVAVAALGLTACENDINEQINGNEGEKVTVEVVGTVADLTRSTFGEINTTDGKVPSTWSGNETVGFSVNGDAWVNATNAVEGSNAEFDVELTAATEGYIYAASPRNTTSSYDLGGVTSVSGGVACYLTIPAEQTPLTGSVDESTHLLFGKHAIEGSIPETVQMAFNHIAAYGKMHIKEYQGNGIKSVTITAESDDLAAKSLKYVFADGSFDKTAGSYEAYKTITIDATNVVYTEANGGDVWFTCLPGVSDKMAGDMTVVITDNDGKTYTKPLATAGKLGFIQGQVSAFTVGMKDVAADEVVEVEGYKKVTSTDELTLTGKYLLVYEKASMYLTGISDTNTKYGIGTAIAIENSTILVDDVDAAAVLTLEVGNTADTHSFKFGDVYLYWGSGNSLATNANITANTSWTISFDASGNAVILNGKDSTRKLQWNTGNPRFACYTTSQAAVQLYKFEDSETPDTPEVTPLDAPVVTATVEGTTINVSWEAVEGAKDYTVTFNGGEPSTQTATTAQFTGLAYSTEYTISVVANPADESVNTASAAGTVEATTESDPSINYSGEYMIVAKRSTSNFFYMTSDVGNASTDRLQGVDTGVATTEAIDEDEDYVWVVEKVGNSYYIKTKAEPVQYISWPAGENGATLVDAQADAKALTIVKQDNGAYHITFMNEAELRQLSLNNSNGDYFAFYKGTQINDLYLIPFTGKVKATTTVEFDGEESYTVNLGDEFTSPSCNVTIGDQLNPEGVKPTYTSSDESVATVAEDGTVTLLTAGTTTITATVNATDTYKFGEDSYKITVVDGSITGSTVTMSTFTATSASLDTVISYACNKGGGTSNPAINGGEIRLYQKGSGQSVGGYIIITAIEGYKIQSITIGSSMKTTLGYGVDSDSATVTNVSLAANGKYTLSDLSAQKVSFHCYGTSSSTRLYVNYLEVTYVKE